MSAVPLAAPAPRPRRAEPRTVPLEVVPTRRQRRARPRAVYALVSVAGVFAILLTQLMLSIVLSDGAYRITALEAQRLELDRSSQILSESLEAYRSPQYLAVNAESLGMVISTASPVYLLVSDGAVKGDPQPAGAGSGILDGRDTLIGNVLLTDVPLVALAAVGTPEHTVDATVIPASPGPTASTPGALPSPVTR